MAVSIVLLGASASLAVVLQHDGVGIENAAAANAPIGAHVRMRGTPASVPALPPGLLDLLPNPVASAPAANFTVVVDAGEAGVVWVTSQSPIPTGRTLVIDGVVVAHSTPGAAARPLTIVRAESWTKPLLFR